MKTILLVLLFLIILVFLSKQEYFQMGPLLQLQQNQKDILLAQQENKINPFSEAQYNYNNWKQKYVEMCSNYNYNTKIQDTTYQQSHYDLIMNEKIQNDLIQTQGLVYKFGQCVENGNRGCNCPDSSFTFVEDMSFVLKDAPKKPGCIQLTQSPYCYSLDGVIYQPDINRLSTEQ